MKALGFCVSRRARTFHGRAVHVATECRRLPSGAKRHGREREQALRDLNAGTVQVVFTVDLFNEGVDVPNVDTLLLLAPDRQRNAISAAARERPPARHTENRSARFSISSECTGRNSGSIGAFARFSVEVARTLERQVEDGFPFLPAGCHLELDRVAQEEVLRSIRTAIPTAWRDRCAELRSLGDVDTGDVSRGDWP